MVDQVVSENPARVLVADKNLQLARNIQITLQKEGFATAIVPSGPEALKILKKYTFDLALVEVLLPKLLGTEVCMEIKKNENSKRTAVILMSEGLKDIQDVSIARKEYRADDYLLKPFPTGILIEKIKVNLNRVGWLFGFSDEKKEKKIDKKPYNVDDILTMPDDKPLELSLESKFKTPIQKENLSDHRKDPRAPLNIRVDCHSADMFFSSPMMNISKGGIFVRTDKPLPVGKVLKLQFAIPDQEKPIKGYGRVVWVEKPGNPRPCGMGVRFKDFPKKDLQIIVSYVNRLQRLVNQI